ncbi:MAG: TPM domain-containing protein [Nitrospiria bacterium]
MAVFLLLIVLGQSLSPEKATFPSPEGVVNDFAGILDARTISVMTGTISDFQKRTSIEIAVVTIPSFSPYGSIEEYAASLFKTWKIGKAKKDNGLLLIAALKEKKIRIEVGYGLEEIIPDGLAGEIIRRKILPPFKEGRYGNGLTQGVQTVIQVIAEKKGIDIKEMENVHKKSSVDPSIIFNIVIFILFLFFILSRLLLSSFSGRDDRFWRGGGGGFGGGFGGFGGFGGGGGFGGFGGGASGGGGASEGWVLS